MTWQDSIRNPDCELCPLHRDAQYVCLMGSGPKKARLMIVGEAPGAREDETHQAFVGPAGQLLTDLLTEVGISREECYITNAVKCRPEGNATPSRGQAKVCADTYLTKEIQRVGPDLILTLGNSALQVTTGRSGITKYRGKSFTLGASQVIPTFHPAAALRSPKYLPAIRADFAATSRLLHGEDAVSGVPGTQVKIVRSEGQFNWLLKKLGEADEISFDLETDGLDEWRGGVTIVTAAFSWGEGSAVTVPFSHPDARWTPSTELSRRLGGLLAHHPRLIAHNGKFDARWFSTIGVHVRVAFDTMLAAHLLDENQPKGLEYLVTTLLGIDSWKIGDAVKDPRSVPLVKLCIYNGRDADYTLRLYHLLRERLIAEPRLARLFVKLMMPASHALTKVERGGIYIHKDKLLAGHQTVAQNLTKLTDYMDRSSGGINYNSPQQVAPWLFERLKLPIGELTGTGNPSTKEGVLLHLATKSKPVAALLKHRKWQKYLGYLNNWSDRTDSKSRVHPSFLLHGTVTGRLSSRSPNLQQVPRDMVMRSMFGAPKGWKLIEADYSQIELRIIAMLSQESTMLRLLSQGLDLHSNTASSILEKPSSGITKDERVIWGKHPNFGLAFGMSPGEPGRPGGYVNYCYDNGIEVSYDEAEMVWATFHRTYPKLRPWYERQKRLAHRYKRVNSMVGRVRHLPDIDSTDRAVRAEAERQAINSVVQGLASDICLFALVRLDQSLEPRVARVVGSIHDSILVQVREDLVIEYAGRIKATMEDMVPLRKTFGCEINVPIKVDVSVGDSWGSGEDVEFD